MDVDYEEPQREEQEREVLSHRSPSRSARSAASLNSWQSQVQPGRLMDAVRSDDGSVLGFGDSFGGWSDQSHSRSRQSSEQRDQPQLNQDIHEHSQERSANSLHSSRSSRRRARDPEEEEEEDLYGFQLPANTSQQDHTEEVLPRLRKRLRREVSTPSENRDAQASMIRMPPRTNSPALENKGVNPINI